MKSDGEDADLIWGIPMKRAPASETKSRFMGTGTSPFGATGGVATLRQRNESHILCLCHQHNRGCVDNVALTLKALLYFSLSLHSRTQGKMGTLPRPILRAVPGSVVSRGSALILWCEGILEAQEYRLHKEERGNWWNQMLLDNHRRSMASFSILSMSEEYAGCYHCVYYGQGTWSKPSDSLELVMTESSEGSSSPPLRNMPTAGLESYWQILTGASVGFFLLLFFLLLLLLWHRSRSKGRKSGTAESAPGDRGLLGSSSPAAAVQEEILYAAMDTEPKNGVELDRKAAPEDPQDVTYAQLCLTTFTRGIAASPPSPAEPSLYATLAARSPKGAKE